jgi:hypothetical protein
MHRIILFGKSKRRTRTTFHLARAFKDNGNEVLWLNPSKIRRRRRNNSDRWILNRIDAFSPDIIFIYSQDIPLAVLQKIAGSGIRTLMYYEDMADSIPEGFIQRGALVDFFLATNRGKLTEYKQAGVVNPVYFTGACDRYDHRIRRPLLPLWKSDIAFIGRARADEPRVFLTRKLAERFNVKVYGKDWKPFGFKPTRNNITPRTYALVCAGAKIVLGADITDKIEGYWSNRLWLTLGCGGFFLTAYVRGMENFFENKKHLVWYRNETECLSLVEEYLAKPKERKAIARQGYQLVHERYTFHHFADRVMALLSTSGR